MSSKGEGDTAAATLEVMVQGSGNNISKSDEAEVAMKQQQQQQQGDSSSSSNMEPLSKRYERKSVLKLHPLFAKANYFL